MRVEKCHNIINTPFRIEEVKELKIKYHREEGKPPAGFTYLDWTEKSNCGEVTTEWGLYRYYRLAPNLKRRFVGIASSLL